MTQRPAQPEPFVRGAPYPAAGDVPYPRANPADTARLPSDTWHAATVPAGVRLELVGDAEAIDIAYRTTSGNLGYRGDGAGITFSVWRAGRKVCEAEAVLGDGLIRLSLGSSAADKPATIYLPEGMQPLIQSLTAVKGEISPAPQRPRWIAYGDSVTQGWIASGPAQGWAAIAARKSGLDLANMGYASAGRGEIVSAEHIAALPADIISVAYGASCWTRVPHSVGMVSEGFTAFLDVVRDGHPTVPIVVVSPVVRPDAEDEPNRLGATLAEIRQAIESATRDRILSGDETLALVAGGAIITADHLGDGIHPDDEGHKRIAAAVSKALTLGIKAATALPGPETLKVTTKLIRASGQKERQKVRVKERNKRRGEAEGTKVEIEVGAEVEIDELEVDEVETDELEVEELEVAEVETDELEVEMLEVDEPETDELEVEELEVDEPETDELEVDEVETDELETDEVEDDEVETDELETDEVEDDEDDEVETDEVEVEDHRHGDDGFEYDEVDYDEVDYYDVDYYEDQDNVEDEGEAGDVRDKGVAAASSAH